MGFSRRELFSWESMCEGSEAWETWSEQAAARRSIPIVMSLRLEFKAKSLKWDVLISVEDLGS